MVIVTPDYKFGTSPYIVNPILGVGSFTTVGSAVVAAASAGGGTIYIQPGTYTENITFPSGISVVGSDTGTSSSSIVIEGNQTFSTGGSLAFENIEFFSNSGTIWSLGASSSIASEVEFVNCYMRSVNDTAIQITNSTSDTTLFVTNTTFEVGLEGISIINNGENVQVFCNQSNLFTDSDAITTSGSDLVTIRVHSCEIFSKTGNAVVLGSPFAELDSSYSYYTAAIAAFYFTDTGQVTSYYDIVNASGTHFAQSTGHGALIYSYMTVLGVQSTDPQITAIPQHTLGSVLIWSDVSSNNVVNPGTGSFATDLVTLTLPSNPSQGDTCSFVAVTPNILTIQATTGQFIRMGEYVTSLGGSVTSSEEGDSLTMVYRSPNSTWVATSSIGNWLIT